MINNAEQLLTKQIQLYNRLNNLSDKFNLYYKNEKLSNVYLGAIKLLQSHNLDCMSQAAHSLRELLLPFSGILKRKYEKNTENKSNADLNNKLYLYYSKLTDIAHHGLEEEQKDFIRPYNDFTEEDFIELVSGFEQILLESLRQFSNLLPVIDTIVVKNPYKIKDQEELIDKLGELLDDPFIEEYFYLYIDSSWTSWLFENNYLSELKNTFTVRDKITKLNYLKRVANDNTETVRQIILSIKMNGDSSQKYIMKVINITDLLDNESISIIIDKMTNEKWFQILGRHIESVKVNNRILKQFIESYREGNNQEK